MSKDREAAKRHLAVAESKLRKAQDRATSPIERAELYPEAQVHAEVAKAYIMLADTLIRS